MYLKSAVLLAWFSASYLVLLLWVTTWWQGALAASSLALSIAGIGFCIQHDANHNAYSRNKVVNRILERTLDMLGASSYLWRWKHNVFHHTYTNVNRADNDINLGPFARLSPLQPRRALHRYQHIYMWALYGFTAFHMHFVEDFLNLTRGRVGDHHFPRPQGVRFLEVIVGKLVLAGWALLLPMFFHPWWIVLAFYAATWFVVGLVLGIVFQLAHCFHGAEFPEADLQTNRIDDEWALHQVRTTANFAPNVPLLTWYLGGLNYQIEHHLFPKVCHIHYPRLSGIVREVCDLFSVRYTSNPSFLSAIASHGLLLRNMGRHVA